MLESNDPLSFILAREMKLTNLLLLLLSLPATANAEDVSIEPSRYSKVLFEDEFSGDHLGERWGMYKSASVIKDGVMVGITPEDADHPSVNTIRIDPTGDLEVAVAFKFEGSKRFQVMYRDRTCTSSHAGHICHVSVAAESLILFDGKTGIFRKDIREQRKLKQPVSQKIKELLKTKIARFPMNLDITKWHSLTIRIQADVMEVAIDGKHIGRLQSEGIGHSTKDQVNLTTNDREVHYDHFKIKSP